MTPEEKKARRREYMREYYAKIDELLGDKATMEENWRTEKTDLSTEESEAAE